MATTYDIQITSNASHVRSSAKYIKNGSNVTGYVYKGEKFTATKVQNGWYYIKGKSRGKNVQGWVYQGSKKEYVKLLKTNTPNPAPKPTPTPQPKPEPVKEPPIQEPFKTITVAIPGGQNILDLKMTPIDALNAPSTPASDGNFPLIFKDVVTSYNHETASKYVRNMHNMNLVKNWVDNPDFAGYYDIFPDNYDDISNSMERIRRSMNIFGVNDRDKLFNQFNRFKIAMPDNHATTIIPYVFFTKPILNLVDAYGKLTDMSKNDPLWESLYADEKRNFLSLDGEFKSYQHDFNALLSNAAMSFQSSDEVLKTVEHGETYTGWKMVYGRNTNESNTAGQFSINYMDDHNYNIYKMHKIWVEYINKAYRGHIPPAAVKEKLEDNPVYRRFRSHLYKKILTYPCALYYIVCAADGETILYWTKYYGVFPVNTPASVSSWTHGSHTGFPEFSINYVYSMKEDFHPITLSEFNRHSAQKRHYRKAYDPETNSSGKSLTGAPYIEAQRTGAGKLIYKLRFRD